MVKFRLQVCNLPSLKHFRTTPPRARLWHLRCRYRVRDTIYALPWSLRKWASEMTANSISDRSQMFGLKTAFKNW